MGSGSNRDSISVSRRTRAPLPVGAGEVDAEVQRRDRGSRDGGLVG